MAISLTPDHLVAALKAEGVRVREYPGWRTHNRNHKGPWGPVHGVMVHHTVTGRSTDAVRLCHDGHSTLPGPLCQIVIERDGTAWLIGNGRANHAGGGDPNVLAAVKDERYTTTPPAPHVHDGSSGAVDGNQHFYGMECANLGDGKDPWPAAQVEAVVRVSAAICRAHSWSAKSTIGHKEWSDWKSDPRGPGDVVAMPSLRAKIQERLNHTPSWSPSAPAPTPTPAPTPPREARNPMIPNITHLTRPEDYTLFPGSPQRIYFTGEYADEPNQHGDGGKTVLTDASYVGRLSLEFTGLAAGEHLEVRVVEEATNGDPDTVGDAIEIDGRGDGSQLVKRSVPVVGEASDVRRVAFQVTNQGSSDVTLSFTRLMMLSWPQ